MSGKSNAMNAIVLKIPEAKLRALLADPDAGLVLTDFEGKGHPDVICVHIKPKES